MLNIPVKNPLAVQLITVGAGIAAVLVAQFLPHYSALLSQILQVIGIGGIGVGAAQITNKASEPGDAQPVAAVPQPWFPPDRARVDNERPDEPAEIRAWRWQPAMVCALLLAWATQPACASFAKPPCDEAKLRALDTAYLVKVGKACLKYASAAECPELPELRAEHSRALRTECPQ